MTRAAVGDATYRQLIDAAFSAAGQASYEMARTRFADAQQATRAVESYRDLLDAVKSHLEYFLPIARGVAGSDTPDVDTPGSPAALREAIAQLAQRAQRAPLDVDPARLPAPALLWRRAATAIRAGRELLDTHRDADMGWRTPDAWLIDSARARAAAVGDLAEFLRAIARSGQPLALRAREASRSVACADLVNPASLRIAAASIRHHAAADQPIRALDELTPASRARGRAGSTTAQPLAAAETAMHELRQLAWQHARDPHPSIRTVGHYALLAVGVHHHVGAVLAAAAHRRFAGGTRQPELARPLQRAAVANYRAAEAWRAAYLQAGSAHTAMPGDGDVYQRVARVRAELATLTRTPAGWRGSAELFPTDVAARKLLAACYRLLRPVEEIATWQTITVGRLISAGELLVPAATVDRDTVTDDPNLVAARLAGKLVPCPASQPDAIMHACGDGDRSTWTAVKATAAVVPQPGIAARHRLSALRAMHRAAKNPAVGL